jgi:hypothetical protein
VLCPLLQELSRWTTGFPEKIGLVDVSLFERKGLVEEEIGDQPKADALGTLLGEK